MDKLPPNEAWEAKMISYLEGKGWEAGDAKRKVRMDHNELCTAAMMLRLRGEQNVP